MDSLEELHNDLFAKFVPSQEFLLELQKAASSATLMQDAKHFLGCLAEMLTFFICIFFLKQWLQFDLFRDYPWAQAETAVFHLNNNNVNLSKNQKSLKSKRFWKRKNRSRSPSRSVGRSEISEEIFTSSEDNCSSISIDNVSSDLDSDIEDELQSDIDNQNNLDLDDDYCEGAEINDAETEDSFHSNLLQQEELSDDNDGTISDAPSLDSQLSWFQEHYIESSESDYSEEKKLLER